MKEVNCLILGAGIAGLSCAYYLRKNGVSCEIFEEKDNYGGLCSSFNVGEFTFDSAVHLSFTNSDIVRDIFDKTKYISHQPVAYNYYHGYWLKHPVLNNLYNLPVKDRVEMISSVIERNKDVEIENYSDFLHASYGKLASEKFYDVYTRKYWTAEPDELSTTWVGNRLAKTDIRKILSGSMQTDTGIDYYAKEMRYPEYGGYQAFLKPLRGGTILNFNKRAVEVDCEEKIVKFHDGDSVRYNRLISSIPLPVLIRSIKNIDRSILDHADKLAASKVSLVSVGFKRPDVAEYLWMYVYDEDIWTARINSPSVKSRNNVPSGCSSLQFEIYHNPRKSIPSAKEIIENVKYSIEKMKLCDENDILFMDYRLLPYGNVIFYKGMEEHREACRKEAALRGLELIGRFGEWDYLWSDQSFLSGKEAADRIVCER